MKSVTQLEVLLSLPSKHREVFHWEVAKRARLVGICHCLQHAAWPLGMQAPDDLWIYDNMAFGARDCSCGESLYSRQELAREQFEDQGRSQALVLVLVQDPGKGL